MGAEEGSHTDTALHCTALVHLGVGIWRHRCRCRWRSSLPHSARSHCARNPSAHHESARSRSRHAIQQAGGIWKSEWGRAGTKSNQEGRRTEQTGRAMRRRGQRGPQPARTCRASLTQLQPLELTPLTISGASGRQDAAVGARTGGAIALAAVADPSVVIALSCCVLGFPCCSART